MYLKNRPTLTSLRQNLFEGNNTNRLDSTIQIIDRISNVLRIYDDAIKKRFLVDIDFRPWSFRDDDYSVRLWREYFCTITLQEAKAGRTLDIELAKHRATMYAMRILEPEVFEDQYSTVKC